MNDVLRPYLDKFASVYLDDILVYSSSMAEHIQHLRAVLTSLRAHQLCAKQSKCSFAAGSMEYLGHIINGQGVSPDPAKVDAVLSWPAPQDKHDAQVFLGLAGYYSRFVK